jgi:hypothetical protein
MTLTELEKESIIAELLADGTPKGKSVRWVDLFSDWLDLYRNGEIILEPRSYAEYWINTILFPAGYGTTVFARQGMGKTNLGVFSMQTGILLHPNWVFIHTIPFPEVVKEKMGDKFIEVRSAREMMLKIIEIIRAGKVPAFVPDEFDSVFSSRSFSSRPAKSWLAFTWRQRHFLLRGPLMLYHDVKTIPPPIRNKELGGEILWIKGWEDERYVSNPDLKYYMKIGWARIPYLSHGNTGFEIDVDFAKLLNKVSGSQEEVMDQIEEKLMGEEPEEKDPEVSRQEKREMKLSIIERGNQLKSEGLTRRQISDELKSLFPDAKNFGIVITPDWVKRNIA